MSEVVLKEEGSEGHVVRRFFEGLRSGRLVDALGVFATDATVVDESGRESRGIREITATLLPFRVGARIQVEQIFLDGPDTVAVVRVSQPGSRSRRYRDAFRIEAGRIQRLRVRAL